ncbi:MAG: hypothetical protein MUC54_04190 [Chloroflexi bacterium]|jgi:hypothetical protein|nr:hypothetical protein [Chloroflexota bacterium]
MDPYREVAAAKNVIELSENGGRVVIHRRTAVEARGSGRIRRAWHRFRTRRLGYHDGLTEIDCRLPNGQIGKVEAVLENGEWVLVCRMP